MGKKANIKKVARELAKKEEEELKKKKKPVKKAEKKAIKKKVSEKAKKEVKKKGADSKAADKKGADKRVDKKKSNRKGADEKGADKIESKKAASKKKTALKERFVTSLRKNKKRIFAFLLTLIMLGILFFVGILVFRNAFSATPIAKFLPAKYTVATLEININPAHGQVSGAFELLENHADYSQDALMKKLEDFLDFSFEKDLAPWIGRSIGLAVLDFGEDIGVDTLYFSEFISGSNLTKFLGENSTGKTEYNNRTIYEKDGDYFATIVADYLFVAKNKKAVQAFIDARGLGEPVLHGSSKYRRIDNNLPFGKTAFVYINYEAISDGVFKHFPFLSERGISMQSADSLLSSFKAEGISVTTREQNFVVQSFLSLSDKVVDRSAPYLSSETKYRAGLLDYISEDVLLFWGGQNLDSQIKRIIRVVAGGNPVYMSALNGLLKNYVTKYLGAEVDFNADVAPLIENEFLFVLEDFEGEIAYKFIADLDHFASSKEKVHDLAEKFAEMGAVFEPQIVERTLTDGSVGREIIAVPGQIVKSEFLHGTNTVFELNMGEERKSLFYSLPDNIVIFSNSKNSLLRSMDLFDGKGESIKTTKTFSDLIYPIVGSSDEVSYFNVDALSDAFLSDFDLPEIIGIVSSLTSGRNYFHDGIVTINYLHIK